MKYEEGDTCCIMGNTGSHKFEDGELVEILDVYSVPDLAVYPHYKCRNSNGTWYVDECDLDLYKSINHKNNV